MQPEVKVIPETQREADLYQAGELNGQIKILASARDQLILKISQEDAQRAAPPATANVIDMNAPPEVS